MDFFIKTLEEKGPFSLKDFMELVLYHPLFGYYKTKNPLGSQGDFITAPEISQLFGEMIGLFMAANTIGLENIIELGPGKGTLLKDALRILIPLKKAPTLHLVETSSALKKVQEERLKEFQVSWHETITTLPLKQSFIIANEFFDALPIDQYIYQKGRWYKRFVEVKDSSLRWLLKEDFLKAALLPPALPKEGDILEVATPALEILKELSSFILKTESLFLIIDYGYQKLGFGDTLQALYHHKHSSPFLHPGKADLTSHVNFAALKKTAEDVGCKVYGPIFQSNFLRNMGIELRATLLKEGTPKRTCDEIEGALQRLIHPEAMGALFKVMAIASPSTAMPFGFQGGADG